MASRWILTPTSFYVDTAGDDVTGDGSSAYPWATVGKAVSYLNGFRLNAKVTINVAAGHYLEPVTIVIDHVEADFIEIVGADILTKNMTSIQSTSGSVGAWVSVINLNNVTDIVVGDFVAINVISGGTNNVTMYGFHEVINVDVGTSRITVANKNKCTLIPSGAVLATVYVFKTRLSFDGVEGIHVKRSMNNYILRKVAVVHIDTANQNIGVVFGNYGDCGSGRLEWVGVSGFYDGIRCASGGWFRGLNVFISNCVLIGLNMVNSVWGRLDFGIIAGNPYGIMCHNNSSLALINCMICGNSTIGVNLNTTGQVIAGAGNTIKNNVTGVSASRGSFAALNDCIVQNNTTNFNPTVNTVGNFNAYIQN